ncbi:MAG: hypothetical protein KGL46_04210 [Hyphomicrobiales bacterium]|nr:hypothetical protein [Hyphomicrobiales bacterium]
MNRLFLSLCAAAALVAPSLADDFDTIYNRPESRAALYDLRGAPPAPGYAQRGSLVEEREMRVTMQPKPYYVDQGFFGLRVR